MKNVPLMLLFACLAFQITHAQIPSSSPSKRAPSVQLHLDGFDPTVDTTLNIKFSVVVPDKEHQKENTLQPDANGRVSFTPNYGFRYQQIWLIIEDLYFAELVLDQGLEIKVRLNDLKEAKASYASEHVTFSGPDGEMNQFVNEYNNFRNENRTNGSFANVSEVIMDRTASPEEKVNKFREMYQQVEKLEKQFLSTQLSPYAWILENERLSDYYGNICVVHWGKKMPSELWEELLQHQPKLVSNDGSSAYFGYLQQYLFIPGPEEQIETYEQQILPQINVPEEQERLRRFLEEWRKKLADEPHDEALFKTDIRYFPSQYEAQIYEARVGNFIEKTASLPAEKTDRVMMMGGNQEIWKNEEYLRQVLPAIQNDRYRQIMEQRWEKNRKHLELINKELAAIQINSSNSPVGKNLGTLSNGAALFEVETEAIDTLLGALRSTSPGKAMILDIWATWCAPCINDMKKSAETRKKLQDMDVEVVYLCTASGTNPEGWKKMVSQLDINARHIYLNKSLSDEIMKKFNLRGYPSHVFIDSEGKYHPGLVHGLRNLDVEDIRERM